MWLSCITAQFQQDTSSNWHPEVVPLTVNANSDQSHPQQCRTYELTCLITAVSQFSKLAQRVPDKTLCALRFHVMSLAGAFKALYLRVLIRSEALEGITSHSSALIHNIALISVCPYLLAHFAPLSRFNTVALLEWHFFRTVYRQRVASTWTAQITSAPNRTDTLCFSIHVSHGVAFLIECLKLAVMSDLVCCLRSIKM